MGDSHCYCQTNKSHGIPSHISSPQYERHCIKEELISLPVRQLNIRISSFPAKEEVRKAALTKSKRSDFKCGSDFSSTSNRCSIFHPFNSTLGFCHCF